MITITHEVKNERMKDQYFALGGKILIGIHSLTVDFSILH